MTKALEGLQILEIAEGISGPYCGKLMAGLGAEVIKLEPLKGDTARKMGPFPSDTPNLESSGQFLYLNTGKKSVTLDIRNQSAHRNLVKDLVRNADMIIENYPPDKLNASGLGYEALSRLNPRLIMVSITPFGQTGPYRDFKATDMVVHALSGELYLAGRPEREPLKKGGNLAEYHGGLNGYVGAMAALHVRESTGKGQHVDVSLLEGATSVIGMAVSRWTYAQTIDRRRGADGHPWPNGVWSVKDGYILAYSRPTVDWWSLFVEMTSEVPEFADPKYAHAVCRSQSVETLDGLFQAWLSDRTKEDVYHLAQKHELPFGYIATAPDLLASPQLRKRKFFSDMSHPATGSLPYPGAPFIMSETPFNFKRAPLLGEHTDKVTPKRQSNSGKKSKSDMPLEGIRVLDFSHVWAGPFCARLLGDLGAEVIKVESITRYDPERGPAKISPNARGRVYPDGVPGDRPYNRAGRFNSYNRSKLGLTLDLMTGEGLDLIREIISISDVIVENFSVGVMKRLGIDYEDCRSLRPDIIFISMPGFGRYGPEASYVSYGLTQEAMSGLSSITGYPGELPMDTGVFYGDPTGGLFGAAAAITALWHRYRTGHGQLIDLSQREAFASIMPEIAFDYTMNGRIMSSIGNRHPQFAPHGCYRCSGEDSWVVINVTSDEEFESFCRIIGMPELANDHRFWDMPSRKRHEEELDVVIERWTSNHDSYEVMHRLQKAGVPAGAVLTNKQLLDDPHFLARGFFEEGDHPDAGTHRYIGMPWKFSESPVHMRMTAPCLGEHNDYILGEMLGLPQSEFEALVDRHIIGQEPVTSRKP